MGEGMAAPSRAEDARRVCHAFAAHLAPARSQDTEGGDSMPPARRITGPERRSAALFCCLRESRSAGRRKAFEDRTRSRLLPSLAVFGSPRGDQFLHPFRSRK
jgi:hypothetical protein